MSTKCLICYGDYHKSSNDDGIIKIEEINTTDHSSSPKKSLLSKHLHVIFILRNIFQVPVSQLSNYLTNCPKVEDWICICGKCEEIVKGSRTIYEDLLDFFLKFEEAKSGIIKIVKKSYNDHDGQGRDFIPDITDECRRFIINYGYQTPKNPFKDGDLKALDLMKSIPQDDWIWTSDDPPGDLTEAGADLPADIEYDDHWSNGGDVDYDLVELKPEEEQLQNKLTSTTGRCRPLKKHDRHLKEITDEWKPGYKPKKKKWKPKKKKKVLPPTPLKYPCPHAPDCALRFSNKLTLDTHLNIDHSRKTRSGLQLTCPIECSKKSTTPIRKRRVKIKVRSKCESCNKWFQSRESLLAHIKYGHENRFQFYCKICGIGRTTNSSLENHEARCSKTPEVASTPTTLPETESCPEEGCTMVVPRVTGLETHFRVKHPEREPFSGCPHCEQKYYTKMAYWKHLKSEHNISKPFKCEHCAAEFKTTVSLETHKKTALRCKLLYKSETEATVICDICGGKFGSQASLRGHIRSQHEDKFKLRCEICGKGFGKVEILNVHLFKRHQVGDGSNLKYKCRVEGCSRIFYAPNTLECHMALHEGRAPRFTCEECGKGFHGKVGLTQHRKLMHENKLNEKKFKCEVCGAGFGVMDYLTRHKRTVHKIFPEKRRQDL